MWYRQHPGRIPTSEETTISHLDQCVDLCKLAYRLLPRAGLDQVMKAARFSPKFKIDAGAEVALQIFYEDFIDKAISFGCTNAKNRKVRVGGWVQSCRMQA